MAAQLKAALGKIAEAEAGRRAAETAVAAAAARGDEQAARIAQLRQASYASTAHTDAPRARCRAAVAVAEWPLW